MAMAPWRQGARFIEKSTAAHFGIFSHSVRIFSQQQQGIRFLRGWLEGCSRPCSWAGVVLHARRVAHSNKGYLSRPPSRVATVEKWGLSALRRSFIGTNFLRLFMRLPPCWRFGAPTTDAKKQKRNRVVSVAGSKQVAQNPLMMWIRSLAWKTRPPHKSSCRRNISGRATRRIWICCAAGYGRLTDRDRRLRKVLDMQRTACKAGEKLHALSEFALR